MNKKVWVLYCHHHDYNQHGPTLEAVWNEEPTVDQVCNLLPLRVDTKAIPDLEALNHFLDKNTHLFFADLWCIEDVKAGVRLND